LEMRDPLVRSAEDLLSMGEVPLLAVVGDAGAPSPLLLAGLPAAVLRALPKPRLGPMSADADTSPFSLVRRDLRIGTLLAAAGKLHREGIEQVLKLQQERGLRFGEA